MDKRAESANAAPTRSQNLLYLMDCWSFISSTHKVSCHIWPKSTKIMNDLRSRKASSIVLQAGLTQIPYNADHDAARIAFDIALGKRKIA